MFQSTGLFQNLGKFHSILPQTSKNCLRTAWRSSEQNRGFQRSSARRNLTSRRRMDRPSAEFTPEGAEKSFKNRPITDLWKPALFTLGFSSSCFIGASIWQYERRKKQADFMFDSRNWGYKSKKLGKHRNDLNNWWNGLSDGKKALAVIMALNGGVLLGWRLIPKLQPFMIKYFTNGFYAEKLCSPLLLSTFSHYSFIHLGLNMFVLHSFGSVVIDRFLGVEQFTALYLSAGVIASMAGIAHKAVMSTRVAALGASGAILGILTYSCMKIPDAHLSLIFLPFVTFTAGKALYGIIGFDLLGLILRWRMFDHAAHLGGSLFGIWYAMRGEKMYFENKERISKQWMRLREEKKPPGGGTYK